MKSFLKILAFAFFACSFVLTATSCRKGLTGDEIDFLAKTMDVSEGTVEAVYELIPLKCDRSESKAIRNICVTQIYGSGGLLFQFLEQNGLKVSLKDISKNDLYAKLYELMKEKLINSNNGSLSIRIEDNYRISGISLNGVLLHVETIDAMLDSLDVQIKALGDDWKDKGMVELGGISADLNKPLEQILQKDGNISLNEFAFSLFVYYGAQKLLITQATSRLGEEKKRCKRIEDLIHRSGLMTLAYLEHHNIFNDFYEQMQKVREMYGDID